MRQIGRARIDRMPKQARQPARFRLELEDAAGGDVSRFGLTVDAYNALRLTALTPRDRHALSAAANCRAERDAAFALLADLQGWSLSGVVQTVRARVEEQREHDREVHGPRGHEATGQPRPLHGGVIAFARRLDGIAPGLGPVACPRCQARPGRRCEPSCVAWDIEREITATEEAA